MGKLLNKSIKLIKGGSRLEPIAGDDAYLKYYYKCKDCGGIVIEDHTQRRDIWKYDCPICNKKQKNFPFEYVAPSKINEYKVSAPVLKGGKLERGEITLKQRLKIGFI